MSGFFIENTHSGTKWSKRTTIFELSVWLVKIVLETTSKTAQYFGYVNAKEVEKYGLEEQNIQMNCLNWNGEDSYSTENISEKYNMTASEGVKGLQHTWIRERYKRAFLAPLGVMVFKCLVRKVITTNNDEEETRVILFWRSEVFAEPGTLLNLVIIAKYVYLISTKMFVHNSLYYHAWKLGTFKEIKCYSIQ